MNKKVFHNIIDKIDDVNRQDPNKVTIEETEYPKELLYSKALTDWVAELKPDSSFLLRIAARGQHIARWTVPRESYPEGRGGYLRWREDLKKFHADRVGAIMKECGASQADIDATQTIILKKGLKENPDTQVIEDALCLVFLQTQFLDLKEKTPDDKMITIVQKTWKKMSPQGQEAALNLNLDSTAKEFLKKAVQS